MNEYIVDENGIYIYDDEEVVVDAYPSNQSYPNEVVFPTEGI